MSDIIKRITNYITPFVIGALFFLACTEQPLSNYKPLGYDEIFFDTELSSIWSDSADNKLWIGGEYGELFLVVDNVIKWQRELKTGRIYKVCPLSITPADTTLLIGIRNEGLQIWTFSNGNKSQVRRFSIPVKGYKYSPYDFQNTSEKAFYVSTSNGCYHIDLDDASPTMQLAYPATDSLLKRKFDYECYVYNLQKQKDGNIVGSSPEGVFWLNKQFASPAKRDSIIISAKNTVYVSTDSDTLIALSQNKVYKHSKGHNYLPLDCRNNPKVYFDDNGGNKWLIGSSSIRIGKRLEDNFEDIELPKNIPLESHRNIIVGKGEYTYLITQNSLWRIPIHLNIYNSLTVSAICRNRQKQIFFVTTANQLFEKTDGNKARFIKQIGTEGHILWIAACDKYLYFHTGTNMIYRTPISPSIFSRGEASPLFPRGKNLNNVLTAYLHYDAQDEKGKAQKLFFGTRDGLFAIDIQNKKIDKFLNKKFVSTLSKAQNDNYLLANTLNDGIFTLEANHNNWKYKNSERIDLKNKLILDIVPIDKQKQLILTNHYIFYDTKYDTDSLQVKGFRKILLVNDTTFIAIAHKGFTEYHINNEKIEQKNTRLLYQDISFIPNSCIALNDGSLFLGSALGCLHYVDKESSSWIEFKQPRFFNVFEKILMVGIGAIILASFAIIYLIYSKEKKHKKMDRENNLQKRVVKAQKLIEDIVYLPDSYKNIDRLQEVIKKCKDKENVANKDIYHKTLSYSDDTLTEINTQITLLFQNELSTQISAIKKDNITILSEGIKQADKAFKENDTSIIRKLTIENIRWFKQSEVLKESYYSMLQSLKDCCEVPKVNEKLYNNLLNAIVHVNNTELETCQKECDELIQIFQYIESPQAAEQIYLFIRRTVSMLTRKTDSNKLYAAIINLLKEQKVDKNGTQNIKIMRNLNEIMRELPAIDSLCAIKLLTDEFTTLIDKTKKEEKSKEINKQIDKFYAELPEDIDELLAKEFKINGTTKAGKALALTLADQNIRGADVGRLIGDAKPLNLEGITSNTRKLIRSEASKEKIIQLSMSKNYSSVILKLLIDLNKTNK